MANVKVKLNSTGIREMLKSYAVEEELTNRMKLVQSALAGSSLYVTLGPTRVAVKVARGSDFDEANTGALSRALDLAGARRGTKVKTMKPKRGA
jgi:hypothetical protein